MTTRGRFVVASISWLLTFSPNTFAQKPPRKPWRLGVLASRRRPNPIDSDKQWAELLRVLRELGYVEDRNLSIEWRFAEDHYERLPELATELVRSRVDLILTDGTPATRAAQSATPTTPIVFANAAEPVENKLVTSLARPGGHTTGISNLQTEAAVKQLEMLHATAPNLSRIAVLFNPSNSTSKPTVRALVAVAKHFGIEATPLEFQVEQSLQQTLDAIVENRAGALIWVPDPALGQVMNHDAELVARRRLLSATMNPQYAEAGGLMSYGQSVPDNYRRAAAYIDKILKGASPSDLPVEQATKFYLLLNRKTARALGLEFPPELLVLADKVIE